LTDDNKALRNVSDDDKEDSMSLQLYRVPLDFAWPLDTPYDGFVNSLYRGVKCPDCQDENGWATGYSPFANALLAQWWPHKGRYDPVADGKRPWVWDDEPILSYSRRQCAQTPGFYGTSNAAVRRNAERLAALWNNGLMHHLDQDDVDALIAADALKAFTHLWTSEGWKPNPDAKTPTAYEVNAWGLNDMSGPNCGVVIKARCDRAGEPERCATCNGETDSWPSEEERSAYENWTRTEPPVGDGWQMWETVSSGSPITPVYTSAEELARHLDHNQRRYGLDFVGWMKFLKGGGWAPSAGRTVGGEMLSGPQMMVLNDVD
jgi:hypothetical protein